MSGIDTAEFEHFYTHLEDLTTEGLETLQSQVEQILRERDSNTYEEWADDVEGEQ